MVGHASVGLTGSVREEPRERTSGAPLTVVFGFLDLGEGGAQRLTLATCAELRRERFRPSVLCARGDGSLVGRARASGLPVRCLGRLRRPFDLAAVPALAAALGRLAPRILHVPLYSRASPYLRLAGRLAGVPLIVAHEWSRPVPPRWGRRLVDRLLRPRSRFLAASGAQRAELLAAGAAPETIEVWHAGISIERFGGGRRGATRAALGLEESRPVALVPARLHPAKGHQDLIDALPIVLAEQPELLVLCAGAGALADELAGRIRDAHLDASLRLLGHREDLPDLLAATDFVVLPSRVEGLPSALLEAYAARRAVVATDVGGVAEALADGVEGRLVPARDPRALAAAMSTLIAEPAKRAAMGRRGRERVERDFDLASATRRLEEIYERWLA